jgi:hypothetical protein
MSVSVGGSAPILGILDLSTGVSILNWEAAELLGMVCETDDDDGDEEGGAGARQGQQAGPASGGSGGARGPTYGAGYFGTIRIKPLEQLLLDRPAAGVLVPPAPGGAPGAGGAAGAGAGHGAPAPPQIRLPAVAEEALLRGGGGSSGGEGGGGSGSGADEELSSYLSRIAAGGSGGAGAPGKQTPPGGARAGRGAGRASPSGLQVHEVPEHEARLVLGAGAKGGGGAAVAPPPKLAVAHLKGLSQVGLAGRPAIVVGGDIWGRRRAVLCLRSGLMYL